MPLLPKPVSPNPSRSPVPSPPGSDVQLRQAHPPPHSGREMRPHSGGQARGPSPFAQVRLRVAEKIPRSRPLGWTPRRGVRAAEGARLEIAYVVKAASRVQIPPSPCGKAPMGPFRDDRDLAASSSHRALQVHTER